ncbi:MAG TPA: hypothetical protein VHP11_16835 [Tepidisphaeraceae bacterium]|nr:hypothetical protein [Tepidisphaeraceae bacterium]
MTDRARILVVDDEPVNIELVNAALEGDYDICYGFLSSRTAILV